VVAALAAGALATTGLGSAPLAHATCASFFGIGNSTNCRSAQTSIAIALGSNAIAQADGLLGVAFSLGTEAEAVTRGAVTLATAMGRLPLALGYSVLQCK
jgi:hypothetical protein